MHLDALSIYLLSAATVWIRSNGFVTSRHQNETDCFCAMNMVPVCGTDGASSYTYLNRCILDCNRRTRPDLRWDYDGQCCDFSTCPVDASPVCDSMGRRHLNMCFFEYVQCLEQRKYGMKIDLRQPARPCECSRECSQRDDPICDNLGNTHRNLCFLRNAQCFARQKYGVTLSFDYFGPCCNALCLDNPKSKSEIPICDNFGNVHRTFCSFHVAKCVAERKFGVTMSMAKFGRC